MGLLERRRFLKALQWCVSLGLLGYLASRVSTGEARTLITHASGSLVLAATVQLFAQPFLGALRWKVTARTLGGSLAYEASLRYFWIGTFFNQAVPGSIGGDIVRMWLYTKYGAPRSVAVTSVALERAMMFLTLLIIVLAAQPALNARGAPAGVVAPAAVALLIAIASVCILVLFNRLFARMEVAARPLRVVMHLSNAAVLMLQSFRRTAVVFSLCIAAYVNMAVTMWLLSWALALHVSMIDCLVVAPVIFLAAILPISIGGWGVRESASVLVLGLIGVSASNALALSVLFGLASLVVSFPGLLLWMRQGARQEEIDDVAVLALKQDADVWLSRSNRSDVSQPQSNLPRQV